MHTGLKNNSAPYMKKTLSFILLWLIYGELHSATLRIAVPENLPPYIYPQNNNHSKPGFEIEIALEALSNFDYQVEFVYVPLSRLSYMLNTDRVDGALTISDALSAPNTCLTAPYISYQNIAISLAKNNFYIKELADLANKRIIAFQNATHYLDPAFSAAIISSPDYREMRNQELQVKNLFLERTDLLIMDINIFEYFQPSNH